MCNYDTYVHLDIGHNKGKIRYYMAVEMNTLWIGNDIKIFLKIVKLIRLDAQEMHMSKNSSHGVYIEMRHSWSWGSLETL